MPLKLVTNYTDLIAIILQKNYHGRVLKCLSGLHKTSDLYTAYLATCIAYYATACSEFFIAKGTLNIYGTSITFRAYGTKHYTT